MKRNWALFRGTGRWSALIALVAALGLLAAVACGEDAAAPSDAQDSGAATTDTSTAISSDAVTATTDVATEPSPTIGHEVGMLAPDFTVELVSGESFSLSEVTASGSPVLLYFFATW